MSSHSKQDDSSAGLIARVLWRLAFESVAVVIVVVAMSLLVVAMAAVCLRPEAFAAGLSRVGWGLSAFLGTVAAGTVPLLAFFTASLCGARLSARGEAMALASLGYGPLRTWRSLWPLWMLLSMLALVFAFVVEPPSWRAIHLLKGSPQAAAVGLARLEAGEMRVLPGGGGLVLHDGSLRFASASGSLTGNFTYRERSQLTAGGGWELGPSTIARQDGSNWAIESIKLRPDSGTDAAYRAAPSSPWARDSSSLITSPCQPGDVGQCDRAALVLHRRISWVALVPVLALLGWLLAWTATRTGRGSMASGVMTAAPPLALYGLLKLSEQALEQGLLSGTLAAWLPALATGALTAFFFFRSGLTPR